MSDNCLVWEENAKEPEQQQVTESGSRSPGTTGLWSQSAQQAASTWQHLLTLSLFSSREDTCSSPQRKSPHHCPATRDQTGCHWTLPPALTTDLDKAYKPTAGRRKTPTARLQALTAGKPSGAPTVPSASSQRNFKTTAQESRVQAESHCPNGQKKKL